MTGPTDSNGPSADLKAAIDKDFGSFEVFKDKFNAAATTRFGSGWAWLVVQQDGKLAVTSTANQVLSPGLLGGHGRTPWTIMLCSVWLPVTSRRPVMQQGGRRVATCTPDQLPCVRLLGCVHWRGHCAVCNGKQVSSMA